MLDFRVYQSGPMSVLELGEAGGSLRPTLVGDLSFFKLFGLFPAPNVRFSWSEVERVEPVCGLLPRTTGLFFFLRGEDDFAVYNEFLPRRARKVRAFVEGRGAPVSRTRVRKGTGRPRRPSSWCG